MNEKKIQLSDEVAEALAAGKPVVALESTIIAHGMPHPQNVETALAVEGILRQAGVVPATIAILDGRMRVGLDAGEIDFLGKGKGILKAGDRDIPFVLARRLNAATTVSASLALASAAGIHVFVTGGIGGVGPEGYKTLDISSDLTAMADYPCITVCAGAKAFMDIPGTLEYLESLRVGVIGWRTHYFPLFYTRGSSHRIEWTVQSGAEVAEIFAEKLAIGHRGGLLVGVPLEDDTALSMEETRAAIDAALEQAARAGISGKGVTPFILTAIKEATGGRSLEANISLVKNNAHAGAEIAVALAKRLANP